MDITGTLMADRRSLDPDIRELAEDRFLRGWTPTQVLRHLEQADGFAERHLPSRKTLQRWSNEIAPRDPSGAFDLNEVADSMGSAEVAERIADVLRETAIRTRGRIVSLTRREASFVAAARVMASDLPPWRAYVVARICARRVELKQPMTDVEQFLAFAPWRGDVAREIYRRSYTAGRVHIPSSALLREDADEVDLIAADAAYEFVSSDMVRNTDMAHDAMLNRDADLLWHAFHPRGDERPETTAAQIASMFRLQPGLHDPEHQRQFLNDLYGAIDEIMPAGANPPASEQQKKDFLNDARVRAIKWYTGWVKEWVRKALRQPRELESGEARE